ncbi:MAG: hypothetical protein R2788_10715 [Saprospiraceae bacterium]
MKNLLLTLFLIQVIFAAGFAGETLSGEKLRTHFVAADIGITTEVVATNNIAHGDYLGFCGNAACSQYL